MNCGCSMVRAMGGGVVKIEVRDGTPHTFQIVRSRILFFKNFISGLTDSFRNFGNAEVNAVGWESLAKPKIMFW